ncbi:MAG: exodeoxyribonuclease VII large subunit [Spirochaetales bacterium]|nr:exodeoxyribonuclease VII large subunit [Spirochaetales bacterium]
MFDLSSKVFSVSEITGIIKDTLEEGFSGISISGEISNCRPSSTGHLYFSLKDKNAMISAVMFKGRQRGLTFEPKDGMLVKVSGNLSVYALRGSYQIICDSIEKAGEGEILAMLEERKKRLAAEGFFDIDKKKTLPMFPSKIAVVTSPTGAAVRDILRVTSRRNSGLDIIIVPAPVQGNTAGAKIAEQIKRADEFKLGDVIIVGRGGGSIEDLLPFSDEAVVKAIADCNIPVISAVGHEIDTSLSDLAADVSAPTPSAAAEIVSTGREELKDRVSSLFESMQFEMDRQLERIHLTASRYTGDSLEESFFIMLQPVLSRFDDLKESLLFNFRTMIKDHRLRLDALSRELEAVSPEAILKRGYSMVYDKNKGTLIKEASETQKGADIEIKFYDGTIDAQITGDNN